MDAPLPLSFMFNSHLILALYHYTTTTRITTTLPLCITTTLPLCITTILPSPYPSSTPCPIPPRYTDPHSLGPTPSPTPSPKPSPNPPLNLHPPLYHLVAQILYYGTTDDILKWMKKYCGRYHQLYAELFRIHEVTGEY